MDDYSIIIRPLVTEKGMHFANAKNAYSFEVNKKANKIQIRNAVERLYGVKVTDVRTANVKGKPRRRGRYIGTTKSWKKAVVVLHQDYHIDLF
ncbi:MAG TPA: 50S ribosomal protein L23 [Anaerohalosphaeraceae bacterium]|nr:50S ribosomal protein L23 [Anaerohalosphaeraceae bacterium]HOL31075.1 50S ribosomal protein L23 [Anaerohalosphaeraceae bacterium]HPO69799.1 50S ribosomal protein L23 [Anaerohalosphaeraceae bacterium]